MKTRWWPHFGLILLASFVVDGLAVMVCWNWFVVPAAHVPEIGFPVAVGLRLFLAAAMRPTVDRRPTDADIQAKLENGRSPTLVFLGFAAEHFGDRVSILAFALVWRAVTGS